jgi:hypothetical protein
MWLTLIVIQPYTAEQNDFRYRRPLRQTLGRFVQAGVIPISTNAVLSETHRTWNRPEAGELAKLYALGLKRTRPAKSMW